MACLTFWIVKIFILEIGPPPEACFQSFTGSPRFSWSESLMSRTSKSGPSNRADVSIGFECLPFWVFLLLRFCAHFPGLRLPLRAGRGPWRLGSLCAAAGCVRRNGSPAYQLFQQLSSRSWLPFFPSPLASGPCFVTSADCIAVPQEGWVQKELTRCGACRMCVMLGTADFCSPNVFVSNEMIMTFLLTPTWKWFIFQDFQGRGSPLASTSPMALSPWPWFPQSCSLHWSRPGSYILPCMIAFLGEEALGAPSQTSSSTRPFFSPPTQRDGLEPV